MQDLSKQNSDKNPFFPVRICVLPQVAWWGKGILCVFVAIFAALHPLLPQCRYLFDLCVIL